jgi:ankyrin repeat protein
MVLCLVNELAADVNKGDDNGVTPLHMAAHRGTIDVVRCLLDDLGADVDQEDLTGSTALFVAAYEGHFDVVRCLVREFGADINTANHNGMTALMIAADGDLAALCKWLVKAGADPQARHANNENAADMSRAVCASPELTAYLEAKAHCAQPGCSGAGTKKCQGCMQGRYCGEACHVAHWPAHRAECRRLGAALKNAQEEGGD